MNVRKEQVFEIFSSKGQSEFLVANRVRWDEYQRMVVVPKRMLSYLDNSEALKVSTKELKEQVLSPNEPNVNMEHIVRQARSEKMFQIFSRQGAREILVANMARWEEHLAVLMIRERESLDLSEAIKQLSEKQELLAVLMEGKMSLQKIART